MSVDTKLVGGIGAELGLIAVLVWLPVRYPNSVVQWYHVVIELFLAATAIANGAKIGMLWAARSHRKEHARG